MAEAPVEPTPEALKAARALLKGDDFQKHYQRWPVGVTHYSAEGVVALALDAFAAEARAAERELCLREAQDSVHNSFVLMAAEGEDEIRPDQICGDLLEHFRAPSPPTGESKPQD